MHRHLTTQYDLVLAALRHKLHQFIGISWFETAVPRRKHGAVQAVPRQKGTLWSFDLSESGCRLSAWSCTAILRSKVSLQQNSITNLPVIEIELEAQSCLSCFCFSDQCFSHAHSGLPVSGLRGYIGSTRLPLVGSCQPRMLVSDVSQDGATLPPGSLPIWPPTASFETPTERSLPRQPGDGQLLSQIPALYVLIVFGPKANEFRLFYLGQWESLRAFQIVGE
ncbi:uncharacterized protein B0T15DRAFT_38221 [Chaetomium strumarium]|uniref:Uncharacterized protein n=1 Tax=Chaetomium strumarium TaxID=1170767 RepID=A0AAJ0H259_9PEZI|nr:hypothetical protein B0T15DRAFT_38221 [Chaetomium strumarium]